MSLRSIVKMFYSVASLSYFIYSTYIIFSKKYYIYTQVLLSLHLFPVRVLKVLV